MTDNDAAALIRRFPIGMHIPGRVRHHVMPHGDSAVGALVELDGLPIGFVDSEHLPRRLDQWPQVESTTKFEILRHDVYRSGRLQIRLWPLEVSFRNPSSTHWGHSVEQWQRIKERYPVGTSVTGTVTSTWPANRWFAVTFDETWTRVTCLAEPPALGCVLHFRVAELLEATHRIILAPTDSGLEESLLPAVS